jgi:nitrate/nitrite transport system substrate-binding protein
MTRREFLKKSTIAASALILPSALLAACSDIKVGTGTTAGSAKPKNKIKIGFIPLTDCASVIMAKELGLFEKYGVDVDVTKEASWAAVRDKLLSGDLNAAHCLFGMPFSVYTGVGGQAGSELPIATVLNTNGQAITLSNELSTAFDTSRRLKAPSKRKWQSARRRSP